VLLLEEIGEAPYKVDRLLTQLRLSGVFEGVQAVVLGDFIGGDPPRDADWNIADVVAEALHGLDLPIVAGAPVGHGSRNHPFVLGTRAEVRADGSVCLDLPPSE
jgi:muramoyltetrapeptide carboxypeptidase